MSSFDALESSLDSSRPLDVYRLNLGAESFFYTSNPVDFTIGTTTYTAKTISRTSLGQGAEERNRVVKVSIPADDPFAENYLTVLPESPASVSIFRIQRDESPGLTQVLQFKGVVETVQFVGNGLIAELLCRSIESGAGLTIPRYGFQSACGNVLYEPNCGADPVPHQLIATVTAVSGATITVPGVSALPASWFRGGVVAPNGQGDRRMILRHTGDVLTLRQPFAASVLNAIVTVFAGCNHRYSGDCSSTKFNRQPYFRGYRFIPKKNLFQTGLD